jgi:hypothetical protein
MKLRRFLPEGVEAVRATLPQIEKTGDLSLASALVTDDNLTEEIAELDDIDLDAEKIFPTTFAFCEYFHSLMKDHSPLAYRKDVGFWTWLAIAYLKQLGKPTKDKAWTAGETPKIVYMPQSYQRQYRHLLAGPFYIYEAFKRCPQICKAVMWHDMNVHPELTEQVASRYDFSHNPAYMDVVNRLYFDETQNRIKKGAGGSGPTAPRNLVRVIDQLAMTRDFYGLADADGLLAVLPRPYHNLING